MCIRDSTRVRYGRGGHHEPDATQRNPGQRCGRRGRRRSNRRSNGRRGWTTNQSQRTESCRSPSQQGRGCQSGTGNSGEVGRPDHHSPSSRGSQGDGTRPAGPGHASARPIILAALDSQTTNKVPRWSGAQGDFSAELWLNQVKMLRTMNKWSEEQTKDCLLYTSPSPRD